MSVEASVFAIRYMSAVGVAVLLYDHILTLGAEIDLIWFNPAAGLGYRTIFFVDRYAVEAVSLYAAYSNCKIFLWIFSLTTAIFTTLSNFILAMRVYVLWDRRRGIKWLLMCSFGAALSVSLVFSVFSAQEIQASFEYTPFLQMCTVTTKPPSLPIVLGVWVVFDLFIVILTIYNAFEKPHQIQADVMTTLQHDGLKMFVCLLGKPHLLHCKRLVLRKLYSVLRVINLIVAVVGDATYAFTTFTVLWAMCSVVTSRMQLRVERLRFTRFGGDLLPINFLHL
ncbi:hypothetical protein DFH09DRAFT_1430758 [Mycena vulgaris]|nr:hypothetical protein DFH09DRAFT_1430758 [Mycena vulgaris]